MKYQKQTMLGGKWAKGSELGGVGRAKIVSETNPQPSQFLNKDNSPKTQDVCKVRFEGMPDVLNVSLNRATINGLVDAFGEDSANWQNHYLSVETENGRVSGRAVTYLYLIPEGYHKENDDNGYAIIVKDAPVGSKTVPSSTEVADSDIPVIDEDGEEEKINLADLPF